MKTVLALLLAGKYFDGDGKPHLVEGIILLLIIIVAIIYFDKRVIRKEQSHQRHYKSDKALKRERARSLPKRIGYSFLQIIDFLCGAYFYRGFHPNDEPFRRATETEKRVGGCFMALWPLVLILLVRQTNSFGAMVDSMIYGRHSMGWFYLAYMALIGTAVFFAIKIAPKIPLFISVPIALISWPLLGWVVWKHNLI